MRNGDSIDCPRCGGATRVRLRPRLDENWRPAGNELYCPLCNAALGAAAPEAPGTAPDAAEDARRRQLSALLGGEEPVEIRLETTPEERRFCRDCVHFIRHPFRCRCERHRRETDPMGDCPDFEGR